MRSLFLIAPLALFAACKTSQSAAPSPTPTPLAVAPATAPKVPAAWESDAAELPPHFVAPLAFIEQSLADVSLRAVMVARHDFDLPTFA